jgi:hypothetical protein
MAAATRIPVPHCAKNHLAAGAEGPMRRRVSVPLQTHGRRVAARRRPASRETLEGQGRGREASMPGPPKRLADY